jgi:hypothetical protein
MADMLADGQIKVTYVPAIANIAAPTVAELGAGTDLECLITGDGFAPTVNEEVVSIPKLCETINAEAPGRATHQIVLTLVRQDETADDVAWTTLLRNTAGHLVVRYGSAHSTAYAAGDDVQVFPGKAGERRPQSPEANGAILFQSQWYVSAQPDLDAVVAV